MIFVMIFGHFDKVNRNLKGEVNPIITPKEFWFTTHLHFS